MNPRLVIYEPPAPRTPDVPAGLADMTPRRAVRSGVKIVVTRDRIRRVTYGDATCAKCGIGDLLDGCEVCATCARTGAA